MKPNTLPPIAAFARARRLCAVGTMLAVVLLSALLVLAVLAGLDMLLPFPRTVRMAIAGSGAAMLLAIVLWRWLQARRRHTPKGATQVMEAAHPEFGQQLRTALEIGERGLPADAGPEEEFLFARLITRTEETLGKFSWSVLIPRGRWALWTLLAAGAAYALNFGATHSTDFRLGLKHILSPATTHTYTELGWTFAPRVFDDRHPPRFELRVERRLAEPALFIREPGGEWVKTGMTALPDGRSWDIVLTGRSTDLELYATAGDARTPPHKLVFKPIPKLTATRVQLAYPDYTGLPAESRDRGDVSVVEDTRVRWEFTFTVPPDRVEWRIGDESARLSVDTAKKAAVAEWSARVGRTDAMVSVLDDAGETIDTWRYVAEGYADALPTIELLEPTKDRDATSVTELPVRIRAKDDFGVAEVGIVLEAAGRRDWVLEKVIPELDQRNVSEIATAMLEKVPLTLRDNVRLFAYALDHKPRGGPRTVSPLRSIDIREFKKRWMFMDGGGGGAPGGQSGVNLQQVSAGLMKLGDIIKAQRVVVSDTFLLRESTRAGGAAVTASALPIGKREAELAGKAGELVESWSDDGGIPPDDIALLDTAHAQMDEAAASLGLSGPANVDKGFTTTDRALSTLLQLRKALLTILFKGQGEGQGQPQKPEDKMKSLTEFAKEAERLAREELDVRGQLAPEAAAGTNIEATRRQHEVAVSDGGELYAEIVDHPQANDGAIRLMDDAEKALRAADETLHGDEPRASAPQVELAEKRLMEVAEFLRAMELQQVGETLKKLASKADQSGKAVGESAGGEGEEIKAGQEKAAGQAKAAGQEKPSLQQAARDTGMTDEILGALAEKAGGKDKTTDAEAPAADKGLGEMLADLREQADAGKLAEELGKIAEMQQKGEDVKARAGEAAGKLGAMAREFREAAQRLEASRAANLAAARAQAKELQKQLAAAGEQPGDKGEQKGDGAGNKPGENGQGKGNNPGRDGQGNGNKPGAQDVAKGDRADDKPGAQDVATNEQPGNKPGAEGAGKGDQPGNAKGGDQPQDRKQAGRGGISGDIDEAKEGRGGQAMGRFGKALRSVGDEKLNDFAIKLFNSPFSRDALPLVEQAEQRIEELLAALPSTVAPLATVGRVPESRRREVEDYFRDLSNDFGDEDWAAPPPPGQKSER